MSAASQKNGKYTFGVVTVEILFSINRIVLQTTMFGARTKIVSFDSREECEGAIGAHSAGINEASGDIVRALRFAAPILFPPVPDKKV